MNYQESLDYILQYADYERLPRSGIVWDLKRVERLLERLGNPHLAARTIHVAGTKGKGSTAAMIASILKEAGYRAGFYSSPHLLSYTERIRVNGENIPEADWIALTEAVRPHVEAENADGEFGELTTFEIFTAMAFLHFRNVGADYQVMEVGLGGRLDATNVVPKPEICIITSISYDHTDVLGKTLDKIAGEKAGIIKPGVPVVSAPQFPEAMAVIEQVCMEKKCRLIRVGADLTWQPEQFDKEGQSFHLNGRTGNYELRIPLLGAFQIENAANAVAAAEVLAGQGAHITPDAIQAGLAGVRWAGRLQVLHEKPTVVVDGAHNAYSMERLGQALQFHFDYDRLTLILGFGNDKDISGMIDEAVRIADDVYLVTSRHPKAVKGEVLREEFIKRGARPHITASVKTALETAMSAAGPRGLICAAGSIFVISEVMELLGGSQ